MITGMSRTELAEMYSEGIYAGVRPENVAAVENIITKMVDTGMPHSFRHRLERDGGKSTWLAITVRVTKDAADNTFLNIYYMDASEQIKEEEAQEALLDNLPCGAGVYEFKDGQMSLTYQNRSYWELVGLHEEKFPDPTPMSAVHPEDIPAIMQELDMAMKEGRDVSCNIRLRHLTKGYLPVHLVGRIAPEENGGFRIYATFTPAG